MHIHLPDMHITYWAYMLRLIGIFVLGTYVAITYEVKVKELVVFWQIYARTLDLYVHVAYWLFEVYLECDSHIYSLIYVNMSTVLFVQWSVLLTSYVANLCPCILYICKLSIWHIWNICQILWSYLFLACNIM